MQSFTAADVFDARRVAALIGPVLDAESIGGQSIAPSDLPAEPRLARFRNMLARRIGSDAGRGAGGRQQGPLAPGHARHQLVSVYVEGQDAHAGRPSQPAGCRNVAPTFHVTVANPGENPEDGRQR